MVAASVVLPPLPLLRQDMPLPYRPPTAAGPKSTLPPALLARTTAAIQTPLRCTASAAAASSKKRCPPLPPSLKGASKKPKTAQQDTTAPASCSGEVAAAAVMTTAERRRALDKKVAGRLLVRSWDAAPHKEGTPRTALRCLCRELPRGSRCALHQDTPSRSWMEQQQGADGEVVVPKVRPGASTEAFAEYARWRRSVRMPSRFYVEHVREINAGWKE